MNLAIRPLSCCPPSTVQPSSQRCQNLVSQGSRRANRCKLRACSLGRFPSSENARRTFMHMSRNASTSKQTELYFNHQPVIASKIPALRRCTKKSGGFNSNTQELSCCRCVVRPARGSALATNTQGWRGRTGKSVRHATSHIGRSLSCSEQRQARRNSRSRLSSCFPPWKQRHLWSSPALTLLSLSEDTSSSAMRWARLAMPNSGPVRTFRRRTSWLNSHKHPLPDAQMLLDSRSLL